jgi:hypothetical protein
VTDQVDGTLVALACAVVRSAVASGLWARHRLAHERRDKARRRAELLGKQTEFLSTLARVSVKDIADDLPRSRRTTISSATPS